jgi:small subunit ribosomal protein S17
MSRKTFIGKVISNKMTGTLVVAVEIPKKDPFYGKSVRNTVKFKADPLGKVAVGATVRIEECRPISREKNWKVVEVLNK